MDGVGAVTAADAHHGQDGAGAGFVDHIARRGELKRAVAIVVIDGNHGTRGGVGREQRGRADIVQRGAVNIDPKLLAGADQTVVEQRNGDGFGRHIAVVPLERVGKAHEIRATDGRAVRGGTLDGQGALAANRAGHHDGHGAGAQIGGIDIRAQVEEALIIGVDDAQDRIGHAPISQAVDRRIQAKEAQINRFLGGAGPVAVENRHIKGVIGIAGLEGHGAAGGGIIAVQNRGAAIRGGGIAQIHHSVGAIRPADRDRGILAGAGVARRGKPKRAALLVIVNQGKRSQGFTQGHAERNVFAAQVELIRINRIGELELRSEIVQGIGIFQHIHSHRGLLRTAHPIAAIDILHRAIGTIVTITAHATHRGDRTPGNPIKRINAAITIVHAALRQARQHGEVGGGRSERAVGTDQADIHRRLALIDGIIRIQQANIARSRSRAANQTGDVAAVAHPRTVFLHERIIQIVAVIPV